MLIPAERLEEVKLDNGWRIIQKIQKLPNAIPLPVVKTKNRRI